MGVVRVVKVFFVEGRFGISYIVIDDEVCVVVVFMNDYVLNSFVWICYVYGVWEVGLVNLWVFYFFREDDVRFVSY